MFLLMICQRAADDDLQKPNTEIGKFYRTFWLTAAAEIEMLRVRLRDLEDI